MGGLDKQGHGWTRVSLGLVSAGALAALYLVNRLLQSPSGIRSLSSKSQRGFYKDAFWLTVELTFKNPNDVNEFEKAFRPLAEYCKLHEPGTLSYQMARSETEPLKVVIWERYRSKSDYLDVHKSSKPFQDFRPKLSALGPDIKGHGWLESDMGYV